MKIGNITAAALGITLLAMISGCAAVVVGGGATGGYKVATDERTAGDMVDDITLSTNVKSAMLKDSEVKGRNVDVDVINGVVYLTGLVDSGKEAARAAEIASQVSGVKRVKNDLQIGSRSLGQVTDDKILGSKIKGKLIGEPGVRSLNIDVDVYRGVVYLVGIADNTEQKQKVLNLAGSVEGVKRVVDNIQVEKP